MAGGRKRPSVVGNSCALLGKDDHVFRPAALPHARPVAATQVLRGRSHLRDRACSIARGHRLPGRGHTVGKTMQRTAPARTARARGGFSLVEVALLAVFLLIAVGGLSSAVLSSIKLSRTTEESAIADDAARAMAGTLQTVNFAEIFKRYNSNPNDDPNAPGTAPGSTFDVPGLTPRTGDADGRVGRLIFPSVDLGAGEVLREDVV